jgi:hypothetical protein
LTLVTIATGPVDSAKLRLKVMAGGTDMAGLSIETRLVASDTWIESGAGGITRNPLKRAGQVGWGGSSK